MLISYHANKGGAKTQQVSEDIKFHETLTSLQTQRHLNRSFQRLKRKVSQSAELLELFTEGEIRNYVKELLETVDGKELQRAEGGRYLNKLLEYICAKGKNTKPFIEQVVKAFSFSNVIKDKLFGFILSRLYIGKWTERVEQDFTLTYKSDS